MQDIANEYQVGLDVDKSCKKPVLFKNKLIKPTISTLVATAL